MPHAVIPVPGLFSGSGALSTATPSLYYIQDFMGLGGDKSRIEFRQVLSSLLVAQGFEAPPQLLDISKLPQHPALSVSLSHCRDAGLIGWIPQPFRIGVDVEQWERISEVIIRRVAPESEVLEAPEPRWLWSAKEAVFKSQSETVKLMSSVEVFDWQERHANVWSFKARSSHDKQVFAGMGEIRLIEGHSVALFRTDHKL